MKRIIKTVRNKYVVSTAFVVLYILILHETDIVTIVKRNERVAELEKEIERKKEGVEELKIAISDLKRPLARVP